MSWFWRGFQSAIFYYVSCAPCSKLNYRRKRRIENRRLKAEKASLEDAIPEAYRHPSPFSTNIYWREEMALGPGPPPKKGNRERGKTGSSRELNTGGQGSSAGGSSADTTLVLESVEGIEMSQEILHGDRWNRRRYQRPDEILWGIDIVEEDEEVTSVGPPGIGGAGGTYYTARNPAVNDLHPPVVSTHPTRKSETRWMLQPPPSAKMMEGKEKAEVSRSVSGRSRGSSQTTSLRRQVTERSTGGSVKRAQEPHKVDSSVVGEGTLFEDRAGFAPEEKLGQAHDRDPRFSSESMMSVNPNRKSRPPPIISADENSPFIGIATKSSSQAIKPCANSAKRRPPLSTIGSSSQILPTIRNKKGPELSRPVTSPSNTRPPLLSADSTSSLYVLQRLITPNSSLSLRSAAPTQAADIRLPSATEAEEEELRLPEFESRFPGSDFRFPSRSQRGEEPRGRWSMDI